MNITERDQHPGQSPSVRAAIRGLALGLSLALALACSPWGAPIAKAAEDPNKNSRDFYQVLDDTLADFEYDLRNGNVTGLKDLAIRNIATSENVPPSFRSHLELLVTERILKTSKTRIIQCIACRAKKTMLVGDEVVIASPDTSPTQLARVAKESGIQNFMDIAFAYQPTGMILSLYITDVEGGNVVWTKTYNSENTRAAAIRRGVDFTQTDEIRKQTEYMPMVQYRLAILYLNEPNIGKRTGTLGLAFRAVERYDNRKKEVGFELNYIKDSSTIVGSAPAGEKNLYSGMNLTMLFVHAWNFFGEEENFNRPRTSFMLGVGGTYASGFLGGLLRAQYEWRLGKHWAVTPSVGYRPTSTPFIASEPQGAVGGAEIGVGIGYLF